ncbi:transcription factor MYB77-like [Triticum dicoccoides]|uniref:transcription factor MYB77-like n=1 Tax=Triticum dicoccoides TaxID=85692 RepID=UPI00188EB08E|nr:transcription factor MYB77-like [Triticum dicoccoides]
MHNPRGSRNRQTETDAARERRGGMPDGGGGSDGAGAGAGRIKGSWSPEEDELLRDAVARHGARNWTVISAEIPGRTGKSCRLRWCNQLSPGVHRRAFTPDEDRLIFDLHSKHGNKWATIARKLVGRTDNSVKNHWNSTLRKRRRAAAAAATAGNAAGGPAFAPASAMSFQSVDLTKGGEDDYDDDDGDSDGSVEPPASAKRPRVDVVPPAVKVDDRAPPPDPPTSLSLSLPGTGVGAVIPPTPPAPVPAPAPAKEPWMESARAMLEQNPWFMEAMKRMVEDEVRRQMGSVCSIMASLGRAGAAAATLPTARVDRSETHPAGGRDQRTDG